MKSLRLAFLALFSLLTVSAHAASRVEYILDVSGSMNALSGGEKRIDAAKKALAAMVQQIPEGSVVALRFYSHRVPPADKVNSCKDTELVVPFAPINKQQLLTIVNAAAPLGQTPIAYSLEQAANDFTLGADEQQTIILVSDGEESCGGDPVAVAKALLAKGFKLKINVIGLDVDAAAKNQLAAIAGATGGQYFDAKDAASLTSSLQQLTKESLVIQKAGSSIYGEEIRGGDNYETAVAIPLGKLLRLNHHQRVNQYDYFYVDAQAGQKLLLSLETGEKGVNIQPDNTFAENMNPYAGFGLHGPQKNRIKHEEIIGGKNDARQMAYSVPTGEPGRYYILIGSSYDDQHKDHRFKVELAEQFDAGSKQDAGDTQATALAIQPGTHKSYMNPNDRTDFYRFPVPPGTPLTIRARPASEQLTLYLTLFDTDGVELVKAHAPNEGAVLKLENFQPPKGGDIILKLENPYSMTPDTSYTLEILTGSAAAAPAGTPSATPAAQPLAAPPSTAAPLAAPVPAAPTATTATTSTVTTSPIMKPSPWPGGGPSAQALCAGFKILPFMEKVKFLAWWSGIPLAAGGLFGLILGWVRGRKSGFRKAAKLAAKQQTQPPSTPPKP
jgi:hypothetical protein